MKTLLASWLYLPISLSLLLSTQLLAADLKITIEGIVEQEGGIMIAVLASEQQFNDKASPSASLILTPSGQTASVTLHDVSPGTYAIRAMHDVNGNNKLETNFVGIPKEPWGFSNNVRGKLGPPKWQAAGFEVTSDTETIIGLNR